MDGTKQKDQEKVERINENVRKGCEGKNKRVRRRTMTGKKVRKKEIRKNWREGRREGPGRWEYIEKKGEGGWGSETNVV